MWVEHIDTKLTVYTGHILYSFLALEAFSGECFLIVERMLFSNHFVIFISASAKTYGVFPCHSNVEFLIIIAPKRFI